MESILVGRTALVTGGGRGLGLAMAEAVARAGAQVALLDVREEVRDAADRLAAATGAEVVGVTADVTDETSVEAAFAEVEDRFGVVDALINAAGVADVTSALDITPERFREVVDINLTGTFLVCRAFARRLVAAGRAGSGRDDRLDVRAAGQPAAGPGRVQRVQGRGRPAHQEPRGGVAAARASGSTRSRPATSPPSRRSRCRATGPSSSRSGWRTPRSGRMGEPHELGPLAVYLLGDASAYVVGQSIVIDGGYTAL